jgi:hypothetical protein
MSDRQLIVDRDRSERHAFVNSVLTNPEAFRITAQNTLRVYTQNERSLVTDLLSSPNGALMFFDRWEADIKTLRQEIDEARSNKTFARSLAKYLLLSDPQSSVSADGLVKQRDAQIVEQFLNALYPPEDRRHLRARRAARRILRYSPDHITSLLRHYISATLALGVAKEYGVTVLDPITGWYTQSKARRAIRLERIELSRATKKEIKRLTRQMNRLRNQQAGLVGQVYDSPIELVTILATKTRYEKKLMKLEVPSVDLATQRIALFDEETKQLRRTFATTLPSSQTADEKQAALIHYSDLLWKLFMMSSVETHQLMTVLGQLRALQDQLQATQQAAALRAATVASSTT